MRRRVRFSRAAAAAGLLMGLAVVALWRSAPSALAQQQSSDDLDVVPLRSNFYVIAGAGGNILVQVGPDGVILVDSGSTAASDRVLRAIKQITPLPIRYIINTGMDLDHVGGNDKLARAGLSILPGAVAAGAGLNDDLLSNSGRASVLAHENVQTRLSAPTGQQAAAPSGLLPTKTFAYRMYSMYLNGEGIQVIHQPAAHTDGDAIVFFRRGDVIATGDIIDTTRWPVIDTKRGGTVQGEIDALNRLMDLSILNLPIQWNADRTFLVPGHGHVYDKLDLLEYRDAVTIVRDRVQVLIDEGKTLAQVKAANPTLGYRSQYGADTGPWTTDMFVEAIYNELAAKKGEEMKSTFAGIFVSATADSLRREACQPKLARKQKSEGWLVLLVLASVLVGFILHGPVEAQRGNPPAPPPPRAGAPIDLTGYWVSIVTQDWRWRMVTPAKGDYQGIQLTPAARKIADGWDPAKDEAAGEQCKSYGAPALMSVPGRVHITWQDDNTLKVDTDAGMQTRLLRFGPSTQAPTPAGAPRTWQGVSQAQWLTPRPAVPLQFRPVDRIADAPPPRPSGGTLHVVTRDLRAGYLRKNGVPYSENAVMTEHWDLYKRPNGEQWLTITTQIDDPQYLSNAKLIAPVFKKEPDGSKWDPTPCSARW